MSINKFPKLEGYDLTTDEGCREAYRAARKYVTEASYSGSAEFKDNAGFDAAVREKMEARGVVDPTPQDWVKYAHAVSWRCSRCAGTGQFVTMVVNGRPTGPGGKCFRCEGKGHQTARDAHRNYWHAMKRQVYC